MPAVSAHDRVGPAARSRAVAPAGHKALAALLVAGALCWMAAAPPAQAAQGIYTCTDASGRRLTSDRPIPECLDREQRVLGKDGSARKVVGPRLTPQERLAQEEARRREEAAEAARRDAVRRDRNLLFRFPDQAAHDKARSAALDDVRQAIARSDKRIAELKAERKPLLADAEFYKGKTLPFKLRRALEDNETSREAQEQLIANHQAELVRINAVYDTELGRLKRLWGGALPGTLPSDEPPVAVSRPASGAAVR